MKVPTVRRAMVLETPGGPLKFQELPIPEPGAAEVLVQVEACGVCRTDLHVYDGDLTEPKLPLILGHEIVGRVVAIGRQVTRFRPGDRVGVPWLGYTCGTCRYCRQEQENLCDQPQFTGYTRDGGFTDYTVADERYCFALLDNLNAADLAPLLCAGLIGYRSYRLIGRNFDRLGLYGFGAAAHILCQLAVFQGKKVYAFTSPGDREAQDFARSLGAVYAGDSTVPPPEPLEAAIIFAPVGSLVPAALAATVKGGVVVCGGIHMSDIPSFPYSILWGERLVRSVANLTRQDGEEFLALAPQVPIRTTVQTFPLVEAELALERMRRGQLQGAAVLVMH